MPGVTAGSTIPPLAVRQPVDDTSRLPLAADPPTLLMLAFTEPEPGVVVVEVSGELDLASAPELDARLRLEVREGAARRLIVDLSRLQFLGLHGIAVFERLRRRAAATGAGVSLAALSPAGTRALQFAGVLALFDCYPDVSTALAMAADAARLPTRDPAPRGGRSAHTQVARPAHNS